MLPEHWLATHPQGYWLIPTVYALLGLLLGVATEFLLGGVLRWRRVIHAGRMYLLALRSLRKLLTAALVAGGALYGLYQSGLPVAGVKPYQTGLYVVLVLILTAFARRVAVGLFSEAAHQAEERNASRTIVENLLSVAVWLAGMVLILNLLQVNVTPVLTALGVGGLAVALALQDTLGNLFAGLQIVATRKYRNGDFVRLDGGQEGIIRDINWRVTEVETLTGNQIIVPNVKLAQSIVQNFNLPTETVVTRVDLVLAHTANLTRFEELATEAVLQAAQELNPPLANPDYSVRYQRVDEFGIPVAIFISLPGYTQMFDLRHLVLRHLISRMQQAQIPFPEVDPLRKVSQRSANT